MNIQSNYSLKNLNAFGVEVNAKYFVEISDIEDAKDIVKDGILNKEKFYILGQGWNTLFTKDFNGIIIKINIKGINILSKSSTEVILEAAAGEDWIDLVNYCVKNGWGGIENLSYIPGTVGAGVFQDIGAYGQNFDEAFVSLDAINIKTGEIKTFNSKECKFGYRQSIFKTALKNSYIILTVRLKLNLNASIDTSYHSRYGSLLDELSKFAKPPYKTDDIAKAVINIRKTKLPDWKKVGTAGSFFINPVVSKKQLTELQKIVPDIQFYPVDKLTYQMPGDPAFKYADHVKVAAGWLLEELGWKGKRIGQVGTSPTQALVVINYGGATAQE